MNTTSAGGTARLREPESRDGVALHALIAACPPLDQNSVYCNLLQCTHFASTSVVAEKHGELVGAISGYRVPERPDTLFVWQVAVGEDARGEGLASRMLAHLVDREGSADINYMETTITGDNQPSWSLFERFASDREAALEHHVLFERTAHFADQHPSEHLLRIGPISRAPAAPEESQKSTATKGNTA